MIPALSESTASHPSTRARLRSVIRTVVAAATLSAALGVAGQQTVTAIAPASDDWLGIVNTYRAMSGLAPVGANDAWSQEATAHSCYMLYNGISHDELPGRPGYTPGGDTAGNSGNVAVSSAVGATPRNHIDLWMTGPFHAIGILRHNLTASGFGLCADGSTSPWRSGGTLDVIRGLVPAPRPSQPIVFPGNGATVPLHSFVTESPNPMQMCNWTGSAGLPLIAMLPAAVTSATATLSGPSGPIETCVLHAGNTSDPTARAILSGDNAVIVMPRAPLTDGVYTANVSTDGGAAAWSFTVDRNAPLSSGPPPTFPATAPTAKPAGFEPITPFRAVDTREGRGATQIVGGRVTRLQIAPSNVSAVSANFAVTEAVGPGHMTLYNCTTQTPLVSTLSYNGPETVSNQALVPLDKGAVCIYSHVTAHVVIDVNGYYRGSAGDGFTPVRPTRLFDSRNVARFAAAEVRAIQIAGSTIPARASAVALTVTAVAPSGPGWLRVFPCDSPTESSSVNFSAGDIRPNLVVVPVDGRGKVCVQSLVDTDVVIDTTGFFAPGEGLELVSLAPIRLFDSRSPYPTINPFTGTERVGGGRVLRIAVAGQRGIPADAKAVSVNITAALATDATYLTAYPCGTLPTASNVNLYPHQTVSANGAMVALSASGELCIFTLAPTHVIVDVNGVWR